jgi:hypothetical protein
MSPLFSLMAMKTSWDGYKCNLAGQQTEGGNGDIDLNSQNPNYFIWEGYCGLNVITEEVQHVNFSMIYFDVFQFIKKKANCWS